MAAGATFHSLSSFAKGEELASLNRMTVEELKAEAAKLPADDRFALAEWIERGEDVRALRREELVRLIQHGIEQADRGELMEAGEVFGKLRDRF